MTKVVGAVVGVQVHEVLALHCSPVMVNGILASAMLYFFFPVSFVSTVENLC